MALVVDSSAVIALALTDENATYTEAVVRELAHQAGHAPLLFWYELRNVLIVNERRGRIAQTQSDEFLQIVSTLPITIDKSPDEAVVMSRVRQHGLSVYDASYLALAIQHVAAMATLDNKLGDAVVAEGLQVFSP